MVMKLTNHIVDQRLVENNRPIKRLEAYKNAHTSIKWLCLKCNHKWKTMPYIILNGSGCPKCGFLSRCEKERHHNDNIDIWLIDNNRPIKRIGEYENAHKSISWICLNIKCSYIWTAKPYMIRQGTGCPQCAGHIVSNSTIDQLLIGKNILRLDDYIDSRSKIRFQCLIEDCNHIWRVIPRQIVRTGSGCPMCNIPGRNEKLMHELFIVNNIKYIPQFPIKSIDKNAPAYRLDAVVPSIQLAIEYNGRQHYQPSGFGSTDSDLVFKKQKNRDRYIRDFCYLYNIELIEIDGRDFYNDSLEEYLEEEIIPYIKFLMKK